MLNDVVTAGNKAPQVEFLSSVLPILWMCITVFAWFTPSLMDCRVWSQVIAFGGAYGFTVFRAHFWQKTPAILKWSSTILTVTHIYIYSIIDIFYISFYIIPSHFLQADFILLAMSCRTSLATARRARLTPWCLGVSISHKLHSELHLLSSIEKYL